MAAQHATIEDLPSTPLRRVAGCDESLRVMLEQERTGYARADYLGRPPPAGPRRRGRKDDRRDRARGTTPGGTMAPEDRTKIVDWCYALVDLCRFDRETVAIAMSAVDRFMSAPSPRRDALLRDRSRYQLLAVTALYTSVKIHRRGAFSSQDFSAASGGLYTAGEIESTELEMLHGLGWRMCPPTALQVGFRVLDLMEARAREAGRTEGDAFDLLRDDVAHLAENAVRGYALSVQRSSTVAVAAVLNAVERASDDAEYVQGMSALALRVAREYDFDSPRAIAEARDRLRGLMEGGDGRQADAEDAPEEDTVFGARNSLNEVNELEDIQDLYNRAYYDMEAVPSAGFVSDDMDDDDMDDDDSCATVHY